MDAIEKQTEDNKVAITTISSRLDVFCDNITSLSSKLEELHSEFCKLKNSNKRALDNLLPRVEELLTNLSSDESNNLISNRPTSNAERVATLFSSAQDGDVEVLLYLLTSGVNILERNELGDSALHVAARAGHERAVIVLLGGNCKVDLLGHRGRTPLHYASAQGHVTVVRRLLSAGANVDSKDSSGDFALLMALNSGHKVVVPILAKLSNLLDAVDREGNSVLVAATKSKHWDIVELLLQRGAPADVYKGDGNNPLHLVSKERKYHLIPLMLKNIKLKEKQMRFALYQSDDAHLVYEFEDALPGFCDSEEGRETMDQLTRAGNIHVLRSFLDVCGNVNVRNNRGSTCLMIACQEGKHGIVKLLLDRGALVDLQSSFDGWTTLHFAVVHGRVECVRLLLGAGACHTLVERKGDTALHFAARWGRVECARLLLAVGATTTIKNKNSETAIDVAKTKEIRQILIYHNSQS